MPWGTSVEDADTTDEEGGKLPPKHGRVSPMPEITVTSTHLDTVEEEALPPIHIIPHNSSQLHSPKSLSPKLSTSRSASSGGSSKGLFATYYSQNNSN
jgi:hypothetical protein